MTPSVCLCFTGGLSRLVHVFGELQPLKASMFLNLLTLCLIYAADYWQILLAYGLLTGPALIFVPLTAAVAANLVADTEQGRMQGLLVCLKSMATAAAELAFGRLTILLVRANGQEDAVGSRAGLWAVIVLGAAAALLAARLPNDYAWGALARKPPRSCEPGEDGETDDEDDADERGLGVGAGRSDDPGRLPPTDGEGRSEESAPLLGGLACEDEEEDDEVDNGEESVARREAELERIRVARSGGVGDGDEDSDEEQDLLVTTSAPE
mmetsp:Transcript_70464/g.181609  ORF Transcript_70464/g.181609 Transcript_70464/m.181609 type:complete len:267 (+) Transcript_70464:2-802(+)